MREVRLIIRPPLALRIYMVLFGALWCGLVGVVLVGTLVDGPSGFALIPLLMLGGGGFIISSNLRMRVVAAGAELRVRNFLEEQRFERATILRFVEHTPGGLPAPFGGMVAVLLDGGRLVDLRATMSGPFGRARRAANLSRLQRWLEDAAPPVARQ